MGRSKKNKKRQGDNKNNKGNNKNNKKRKVGGSQGENSNNVNNNKRQRQQRFWIEDCKDSKFPKGTAFQVEVLITRAEVTDDYRQTSKSEVISTGTVETTSKEVTTKKEDQPNESTAIENVETTTDAPPEDDAKTAKISNEGDDASDDKSDDDNNNEGEKKREKSETDPIEGAIGEDDTKPHAGAAIAAQHPVTKPGGLRVSIKRSKSAKRPMRGIFNSVENFEPLPDGDCGDGILNPYSKDDVPDKFWAQRRRLFSKFDEGAQLDKESWYSITPEAIANHIAGRMTANRDNLVMLEPFCGCGGNSIAFALRNEVKLIVCVDSDIQKLKNAAKNATIYGVLKEKIIFIHGNGLDVLNYYEGGKRVNSPPTEKSTIYESGFQIGTFSLLPEKIDSIFLSPPWGGMDYVKVGKRNYSLGCIKIKNGQGDEFSGEALLAMSLKAVGSNLISIFLPRNINGVKLGESAIKADYEGTIILEQNVLNGKLKTVTAYLGL